jgi:hypothetical protein
MLRGVGACKEKVLSVVNYLKINLVVFWLVNHFSVFSWILSLEWQKKFEKLNCVAMDNGCILIFNGDDLSIICLLTI